MAKEAPSRGKAALGGSRRSKPSGKKPHSIHVRRGKSGGFIATHHHKPDETGATPEPEDHVIPDLAGLQNHMADQMGDQSAAPAPAPPQAGPPMQGAPAGM